MSGVPGVSSYVPYLETYIVCTTLFNKEGNLVCIYVVRIIMDLYEHVGRWLEDGVARFGLIPTSS